MPAVQPGGSQNDEFVRILGDRFFASEFGLTVPGERVRFVVLQVRSRTWTCAVEDVVGRDVNQKGADPARGSGQGHGADSVGLPGGVPARLAVVHGSKSGAVNDDVWA